MRAYLATTGAIFGLITLAHILRMMAEGPRAATDPWSMAFTVVSAGMCLWSWRLLRHTGGANRDG